MPTPCGSSTGSTRCIRGTRQSRPPQWEAAGNPRHAPTPRCCARPPRSKISSRSPCSNKSSNDGRAMKLDAMSGGLPIRRIHELAREVEAAGFAGLWITEGGRSAYNLCTAAALATERLGLGTAIAVAFPRSPMLTAQIAWELQEATDGRFVLGLGTQVKAHIERRYGSAFEHPGPRIREYVLA